MADASTSVELYLKVKAESEEVKNLTADFSTLKGVAGQIITELQNATAAMKALGQTEPLQVLMKGMLDAQKEVLALARAERDAAAARRKAIEDAAIARRKAAEEAAVAQKKAVDDAKRAEDAAAAAKKATAGQTRVLTEEERKAVIESERLANSADLIRSAMLSAASSSRSIWSSLASAGKNFGGNMLSAIGLGAGATIGATAAMSIVNTFRSIASEMKGTLEVGVQFNATLEQSRLGIASVLKEFNPSKYQNYNNAITASAVVIDELKKKALETSATFEQLLTSYQGTAGAMASAGIPLNKQVGLIVNISQAMAALGIRTEEMRQEATALMMGNIDRNARLAQTLGITADHIRTMREQGKLYEFLTEKLRAFAEAGDIAQNNITVLESNLKDASTQIAADQTRDLSDSYRELLKSLTDFVKSDAYKETVRFLSMSAAGLMDSLRGLVDWASGVDKTPLGRAYAGNARDYGAFAESAKQVRSPEDIENAKQKGGQALRWMDVSLQAANSQKFDPRNPGSYDPDAVKNIQALIDATKEQLALLDQEGAKRIENNLEADKKAKLEAMSANMAKEAAKAREEGVKKYSELEEKAQERIRAGAKASNTAWYLELLESDKKGLQAQLNGPDSKASRYISGEAANDPAEVRKAEVAAAAFRMETSAKIAAIEKEIETTTESQRKKDKAESDRKVRAEVEYAKVKASTGTLDEQIAALGEEKAALDKNGLTFKADELRIDLQIAKLKDDSAAQLRAEAARTAQREQDAALNQIRDNKYLTERQRQQLLYNAYKDEERKIEDKIAAARDLVKSQPVGSATRAQAQGELDTLLTRRDVGIPHDLSDSKPMSWVDETRIALVGLQNSFATVASSIATVFGDTISGLSTGIQGLLNGTMTLGQAVSSVWSSIGSSVAKVISDMVAQWIVQHTIMAAWSSLFRAQEVAGHVLSETTKTTVTTTAAGVRTTVRTTETVTDAALTAGGTAAHVAGEATKTGSTLFGSIARGAIRLGETIFHGIQVAWRVATHIAGEVAKTAATVLNAGLRIASIIVESLAYVAQAAVGALSSLASIPYVGPFLAVAAMAAIFAAGSSLIKGISKGFATGGYTKRGDRDEPAGVVHAGEWVAPKWMVEDPKFGSVIAGLEGERQGKQGYKSGGFFGFLRNSLVYGGVPKWAQPLSKSMDKYNLIDGTSIYGGPQQLGTISDTRTDAQRSLIEDLYLQSGTSAVSSLGSSGASSSGGSGAVSSQASGPVIVNVAQFNTKQDAESWLRTQDGRRVMHDFIKGDQYDLP